MKKTIYNLSKIIVLFTLICASNNLIAQDYYTNSRNESLQVKGKTVLLGLTINPNIGWMRYNDENFKGASKIGFSYGLLADIGFSRNYFFSTGLLINSVSSSLENPTFGNRDKIRLQYLDIPLTLKLKSGENDLGRFYGQFGFSAGFKVSGKEKLEGATRYTSIEKPDIFRLGLQIGGGLEKKLNDNLVLLTGLSFNNGFSRAINNPGKPKNSYLALNVGVFF